MSKYKKWNISELQFIADNQSILKDEEIAAQLTKISGQNVTSSMIRAQRRKLKIKKPRGRRKTKINLTDICAE